MGNIQKVKNNISFNIWYRLYRPVAEKYFTHYLVDCTYNIVLHTGAYQECYAALDELSRGSYAVVTKRFLSKSQKESLKWLLAK